MKRSIVTIAAAIIIVACSGEFAQANDSTAETPLGGLVFVKTDAISMDSEELFISRKKVHVKYLFTNQTDSDVTTTVAFPLPIVPGYEDNNSEDHITYGGNPTGLNFHTSANGAQLQLTQINKALFRGQDVTKRLTDAGIPLNRLDSGFDEKIDDLPPNVRNELHQAGLIVKDSDEFPKTAPEEDYWHGRWELQTTMTRRQTFSAHKTSIVEHDYTPMLGQFHGYPIKSDADHCINDAWIHGAEAKDRHYPGQNPGGLQSYAAESYTLGYVLKTGANWRGPIKEFHLIIDKGTPDSMVSLCADNIKRISATQFEVHYSNFTPTKDLEVVFVDWPSHL